MADMAPLRLLVIVSENDCVRMELHLPDTVDDLSEEVKNVCGLGGPIRLQYKDTDFGDLFINVTSTSVIKDLTVLKVIQLDPEATTVVLYPVDAPLSSTLSFGTDSEDCPNLSALPNDTALSNTALPGQTALPSPTDSLTKDQWPKSFPVPPFSYDTECQLHKANIINNINNK